MKNNPKIILLKGNGPISINNELLELYPVTTCHGAIGFPLKSLRADNVYIVNSLDEFWQIEKTIKEKPCCFVYAYENLEKEDLSKIHALDMISV
ncbi:hypothetical protein Arnit_0081 [Arcobacter nitrofigilis DSM 7299]|uniref:Uncharacterized protein n=1 Tax=Arcobacter nitrofigilis (strain ATCC 33309 / DSM 7299 / CCUG 15893 / LMG 7604 / NCTC 12251 / CI) TaxID=572480 RepID=D5V3P0_ARCNC|nr:hypothetical protein [Arcobacter nitrofigilis]ADG91751.1 hypothetical protein Arnit_0081 [Arcobacter nitrofigilis DSM 7299]